MAAVGDDGDQAAYDIEQSHNGHQLFRNGADTLKAADQHQAYQQNQNYANNPAGNDGEEAGDGAGNGVHLGHVADTECCKRRKYAEEPSQEFAQAALHALLQIHHGAAHPGAVRRFIPEEDRQQSFGVLGAHTEESGYPHPEYGTRAAGHNCRCYAGDVARAYRGCQSRGKRLELGKGALIAFIMDAFVFEDGDDGGVPPSFKLAHLYESSAEGE
ncbi:hypothetical protein SDC9_178098 [bioreactor metagenome]|uniref:Uncharacterized protein n=1 Tax=bioreactor metagenome TaxID=1076179 RepID=A0A645GV52_9ZZZZ